MAEHQGKARKKRNLPGGAPSGDIEEIEAPGADDNVEPVEAPSADDLPRGQGPDPDDAITRKKAEEANQENPQPTGGRLSHGGWKNQGGAG